MFSFKAWFSFGLNFLVVFGYSSNWGNIYADSYDFIIVGGGTAGCVLASRLSEDGRHSVLVLEQGVVPPPGLDIPALRSRFFANSSAEYVKVYSSVPQNTIGFGGNRDVRYTAATMLGGGSSVNSMWFNRGSPYDYDNWAKITGDSSWGYANMLQFMKKVETYHGDFPSDQHGFNGPITVSRPKYSPGLNEWLEAGKSLGFTITDQNEPQRVSFTPIEFSKEFGRRVSSFKGYLEPALNRPNLKVITKAQVRRIVFERNSATGVIYSHDDGNGRIQETFVHANKEIIVSAGTLASPAILMRSGIGPVDVLTSARIPPLMILPVGRNLHDHVGVTLNFIVNNKSAVFDPERDLNMENFFLYNQIGDGPYSTCSGDFGQAFAVSSRNTQNREWPDLQVSMEFSTISQHDNGGRYPLRQTMQAGLQENEALVTARPRIVRAKSKGRITLNPANVDGDPLIDFKYLSHPEDIEKLLEGIKLTLKIYEETPAYKKLEARYPSIPHPQCRDFKFRSDEYWKCHMRYRTTSSLHAGGTCRMGKARGDANAVVDPKLKVIGIQGLRVADASIFPEVTNANTQAPTYAVAEKAAHMILETWK